CGAGRRWCWRDWEPGARPGCSGRGASTVDTSGSRNGSRAWAPTSRGSKGSGGRRPRSLRRRTRRRRGARVLTVLMLVVALAAAFMFLRSPYFYVTEVEVDGLRTVSAEEVVAWSGLEAA